MPTTLRFYNGNACKARKLMLRSFRRSIRVQSAGLQTHKLQLPLTVANAARYRKVQENVPNKNEVKLKNLIE